MASSSSTSDLDDPQQQRQRRDEQPPSSPLKEDECVVHKTKTIQFCGRTTPIVLQNDNGPCPLLAICNVLLLKNQLNLNLDTSEVSQEKLLSLVAERLIDSNSNVNNEDAGYVENQQQNIADAIDLLPRLTTGIDVNIKFRRIDDFEFTPECAIFDLLDIPLCHGWLVDPQDNETAAAIGPKSYNTLMGELVALETRKLDKYDDKSEEDCVDFAAATTATLGVPSPCLLRAKPFEDSPRCASNEPKVQKGDTEEEAQPVSELLLSETEHSTKCSSSVTGGNPVGTLTIDCDGNMSQKTDIPAESTLTLDSNNDCKGSSKSGGLVVASTIHDVTSIQGIVPECADSLSTPVLVAYDSDHPGGAQEGDVSIATDLSMKPTVPPLVQGEMPPLTGKNSSLVSESDQVVSVLPTPVVGLQDRVLSQSEAKHSDLAQGNPDFDSRSGQRHSIEAIGLFTSSLDGEPVYEGEECISETKATVSKDREPTYESEMVPADDEDKVKDREPVYEGEMALLEQANKGTRDVNPMDEIVSAQGEMISNFLKNTASQLTFYGLFCLQDGLKERELCVFFRNNHFNTMFKFEGELYILATDLGYLNQPDLVWEKLNEVNGNTVFMTNKFKEFRLESQDGGKWDEQRAVASTEDYFATMENATQENSDLQLAIALQQQEFEQQPQHHAPQGPQQPLHTDRSRLITGPHQPARPSVKPSSASTTQDPKSKEKCTIM